MIDPMTPIRLGEEVDQLRRECAAKDAQLCRARKTMEICLSALKERMKNQGDPCRHDILIKTLSEYLSATGPCAHEEEAKRLSTDNFCLSRQIITLTEEAKRLREWMGRYRIPRKYGSRPDVFVSQLWEEAELRRQAKEGK